MCSFLMIFTLNAFHLGNETEFNVNRHSFCGEKVLKWSKERDAGNNNNDRLLFLFVMENENKCDYTNEILSTQVIYAL